jgi:hypothetical protein
MGATRLKEAMEDIGKARPLTREEKIELAISQAILKVEYGKKLNISTESTDIDAKTLKMIFANRYREITGDNIIVDNENMSVIGVLLLYFSGSDLIHKYDSIFKLKGEDQNLSLKKGIMLLGCPGSGKTSLFQALSYNQRNPFTTISCLEIASKFAKKGYEGVDQYMKINKTPTVRPFGQSELGWMFDDLGYEKATKHYGDESLIMEEILFSHSNNSDSKGKIHVSSNLEIEAINQRYGPRTASRINQMFNVIYYKSETDRRI